MNSKKKNKTISETIKSYRNKLFYFIKGKVPSLEDTEDILQEVWYQFSKLTSIDEIENVSGWLYSVSRNKITDFYRKKKTVNLEDLTSEDDSGNKEIREILLLDDRNNPEMTFFKEMFWSELLKALEELPEKQKQVFILNEIEDKTLQEIADDQNEHLKTIISRKGYAIKHLRKKMQSLYAELFN